MLNKVCIKCNLLRPLDDFFKYPDLFERELSSCKSCREFDLKNKKIINSNNSEYIEKERKRHRDKYHRLNYKEKHKPSKENKQKIQNKHKSAYPEKYKAKIYSKEFLEQKEIICTIGVIMKNIGKT